MLPRSSSLAQRRIIAAHASKFSPRDVYARVDGAVKDAALQGSLVAACGPGVLPLLADLYEYTVAEGLDTKPRRDVTVSRRDGATAATVRCWSAVLPWETAYGLSRCPRHLLDRSTGSVTGQPSGMLFLQPTLSAAPTSFWSGGIVTALGVAFAKPNQAGGKERRPWPAEIVAVGRLDPFPNGSAIDEDNEATSGLCHSVTSGVGDISCVLETADGALDAAGVNGPGALIQPSPDMLLEIDEKLELLSGAVAPLCDAVSSMVRGIDRRSRRLPDNGVRDALEDDDVHLLCLALRLGIYSDSLFNVLEGKLSADTLAAQGEATEAPGLSPSALEVVLGLAADPSVNLPGNLDAAARHVARLTAQTPQA